MDGEIESETPLCGNTPEKERATIEGEGEYTGIETTLEGVLETVSLRVGLRVVEFRKDISSEITALSLETCSS